ncbi:NFACT family protein, partial [Candidatus Woesearchaeota archaeon]|nr:NFACT family protein [Candidatus Woesearchaeota archaeon]
MRNQLASIELRVLVSELKQLENSWLSQVYELAAANSKKGGKGIVLQLRIGVRPIAHSAMGGIVSTSEGNKRFLVIAAPSAVFSAVSKPETAEKPGGFCGMLRQHLGNVRLISVSQLGSERIVEVIFSLKQRRLRLIVELFSKGNLILVDEKNVIICCAEHQAWKDRTVRPGFAYQQPPATADFASMNEAQFGLAVLSSEKDSVVKALAVDLGLSGAYAEELCSAAVIDKDKKPQQLSQSELAALFSSLQKLLSRKPSPVAIL